MQELLLLFFSSLGDYRTLPAPAKHYLICFSELVKLGYLFQTQEHLIKIARVKLFCLLYLIRVIAGFCSFFLRLKIIK